MTRMLLTLLSTMILGSSVLAQTFPQEAQFERKSLKTSSGEFSMRLVYFHTKAFRLRVIDHAAADYGSLADMFRENNCVAGVNGGFFLKDQAPSGLMIASGERTGSWGTAKLLSGVIYADGDGIHLLRRGEFRDHAGITALVQAGPFLVDRGQTVNGLSASPARRRTFIATDYRGNWVLGLVEAVSLADLGEALAVPGALVFPVNRALNLDGGTSSGIFFDRGVGERAEQVTPFKTVRNYLGIEPR